MALQAGAQAGLRRRLAVAERQNAALVTEQVSFDYASCMHDAPTTP